MRILILLGFLCVVARSYAADGDVRPGLSTPAQVAPAGRPWRVDFALSNRSTQDLLVAGPDFGWLFYTHAGTFQILNSSGQRAEPYLQLQLGRRKPDRYHLVAPGQSHTEMLAVTEGWVYAGPGTHSVECLDEPHCLEVGLLRLPPDTYRLRWPHRNVENPFKTVEDRAKVWIGEVWSNTLIIQTTEKEPVKVGLDVDPDTLNFKSEGKWITAYLSAPQDAGLLAGKTKFQGTIVADKVVWDQGLGAGGQWMIKFPRSLVSELLKDIRGWELDGMMKAFVSAESGDKMFWGDDKIRILEDPGNAPPPTPSPGQGKPPSTPPGQDKKRSPRR